MRYLKLILVILSLGLLSPGLVLAISTADHSKFEQLQGPFASGPEVTKACLSCHTEAGFQMRQTLHWHWGSNFDGPGKTKVVNNFCVATSSNEPRCTSCHIGYGWKDNSFNLADDKLVDCLACHDQTGSYKKFPVSAGHPNYEPKEWPKGSGKIRPVADLAMVAQSVGAPTRDNCGACHFYGGGGADVKHGDLDTSLHQPDRYIDVHMDKNGLNFNCQTCHLTSGHEIAGSRYQPTAVDKVGLVTRGADMGPVATCESCHDTKPHKGESAKKINRHVDVVACVTCHVPEVAKARKTKTFWDWSTAGQRDADGKFLPTKKDEDGKVIYTHKKGDFKWEQNLEPEYYWFNGQIDYTLVGQQISADEQPIRLNRIQGNADDENSRIWPFKVMRGKQPYDAGNQQMVIPHLFGKDKAAFWKSYDWQLAAAAGMQSAGLEFSGELEFVDTEYFWPINHMVAPKEQTLDCADCHSKNGRMSEVPGIKMRNKSNLR